MTIATPPATVLAVLAVMAFAVGLLAGWWAARRAAVARANAAAQQATAQAAAAGERATAHAATELATLRERARAADADRTMLSGELQALRAQADTWRNELDTARDERAQAAERAGRVAPLEQQLAAARADATAAAERAAAVQARVAALEAQAAGAADALGAARSTLAAREVHIAESTAAANALHAQVAELSTRLAAEREQAAEKLALLDHAREALANQFKALANDILEEKSKKFTEQNQANLGNLLDPLRLRLNEFQGKVELLYDTEGKQRAALAEQVNQLAGLNQVMSLETRNLTQALKSNSKVQGNWGELVLEQVLQASGMERGVGYEVQQARSSDGQAFIPDVVIRLPGDRRLVVDSKVSLLDYERAHSAESEDDRRTAQQRHVRSLRTHVEGLSGKRYEELVGGQGLDFVLMFVPIEPAFHAALAHDDKLYADAMRKNVLLVSPLTLLSVVRLIEQLWRQEKQHQNTKAIADRGQKLYEKFVGFVADLEGVGKALRQADTAYGDAVRKLSNGPDNLVRQAEKLRELGVKSNKSLSASMLELADLQPRPDPPTGTNMLLNE